MVSLVPAPFIWFNGQLAYSPDPADKDKSPREADKYYLLEPFGVPESGAQAEPEIIAPGREITRQEAYALIGGWVF